MAPEQMRSAKDVDTRTDLWAIGTILFELLTGRQVFEGETLPEVCAAVLGDQPRRASELRPDIPEALDDLIARCLEKDADRRFQTVLELSEGLAPFGSAGAQESLLRIRRLGSTPPKIGGRAATLPALSSPARPRFTPSTRLTPNTVRERPGARTSEQPAHQRGRSLPWLGALAACGLALVGAAVLASTRKTNAEHPSSDPSSAALHQEAPPEAKVAVAMPPVSEPSEGSAPVDAAADAATVVRPSNKGLTLHRRRPAPVPVASPVSAPPPSPPAASTPKHTTTEAWNPESFGSRR
jgi:serine/threonine-protein kinase